MSFLQKLLRPAGELLPCRACLRPIAEGGRAGICERCWDGLIPLPEGRCPTCALVHGEDRPCPDPVAWSRGDALWVYHGGRPPLGALLVPGVKAGERGWQRILLQEVARADLPPGLEGITLVTAAPPTPWRHLLGGPDLAAEAARLLAERLDRPFRPLLRKALLAPRQGGRTASARRRLPRGALRLRSGVQVADQTILLVDDVWTTGSTLRRSAQALLAGGAAEVRVLALFRALA